MVSDRVGRRTGFFRHRHRGVCRWLKTERVGDRLVLGAPGFGERPVFDPDSRSAWTRAGSPLRIFLSEFCCPESASMARFEGRSPREGAGGLVRSRFAARRSATGSAGTIIGSDTAGRPSCYPDHGFPAPDFSAGNGRRRTPRSASLLVRRSPSRPRRREFPVEAPETTHRARTCVRAPRLRAPAGRVG